MWMVSELKISDTVWNSAYCGFVIRINRTRRKSKQICMRPELHPVLQTIFKSHGLLPEIIPYVQYQIFFFSFSNWVVVSITPIQLEGLKKSRMISNRRVSNSGVIWTGCLLFKDPQDYHCQAKQGEREGEDGRYANCTHEFHFTI